MGCKIKDETGKRYGKITILGFAGKSDGKAMWHYRCDCGNLRIAQGCNLRSGGIKSCGCRHGKSKYYHAFKQLINQYKQNAKNNGKIFNINEENFLRLTKQKCFYCGSEPKNVYKPTTKSKTTGNINYIYNGLDRIDNKKDYVFENVVSCCHICNRAKSKMSFEDFLLWIKQIAFYQNYNKE